MPEDPSLFRHDDMTARDGGLGSTEVRHSPCPDEEDEAEHAEPEEARAMPRARRHGGMVDGAQRRWQAGRKWGMLTRVAERCALRW